MLGLSPDDPTEILTLAHRLQTRGVRNLVVTLGSEGALIVRAGGDVEQVPGMEVDVVDTTGAGDALLICANRSAEGGTNL